MDWTQVSCIVSSLFTDWAIKEWLLGKLSAQEWSRQTQQMNSHNPDDLGESFAFAFHCPVIFFPDPFWIPAEHLTVSLASIG